MNTKATPGKYWTCLERKRGRRAPWEPRGHAELRASPSSMSPPSSRALPAAAGLQYDVTVSCFECGVLPWTQQKMRSLPSEAPARGLWWASCQLLPVTCHRASGLLHWPQPRGPAGLCFPAVSTGPEGSADNISMNPVTKSMIPGPIEQCFQLVATQDPYPGRLHPP